MAKITRLPDGPTFITGSHTVAYAAYDVAQAMLVEKRRLESQEEETKK